MVDVDEQLRSYCSWLAEQADLRAGQQRPTSTVEIDPASKARSNGRRWWPMAAVAAAAALVIGLLATAGVREAQLPADQPSLPAGPTSVAERTAPLTTVATASTVPTPPGDVDDSSAASALVPRDVDEDTVRPLAELATGDVVIPAYVPEGMVFERPASSYGNKFDFGFWSNDGLEHISVSQWPAEGPLDPSYLADPDHPPVEIAGFTWGWHDFESALIARIGPSEVRVRASLTSSGAPLDEAVTVRFIEGLRAGAFEQFPGPVRFSTGTVMNGDATSTAEIVASDERFELAALRLGDRVCTTLREKGVADAMTFGESNCYQGVPVMSESLDAVEILDAWPLEDGPLTPIDQWLITGVIGSADVTAVRITSPSGDSVVVETGPVNSDVDGRFFIAYIDGDDSRSVDSRSVRLDRLTIEDASQ